MRNLEITRTRGAVQAVLLAVALAIPASTSVLPKEGFDFDAALTGRRADAPSVSSVWERPASGEPAVIVRPPEAPPPAPERTISANPLWEIPLTSLSGTRERPIFSPSRRPPPPAVVAIPVAKDPPPPMPPRVERPQLSLVGTIAGDGQSFGIFVDQTTAAALRLKLGEDYQGWRLQAVQGREVTLERDQRTTILSLPQPGTTTTELGRSRLRTETAATPGAVEPVHHRDSRR